MQDKPKFIFNHGTGFTEADVIGTTVIQSKEYIYHILKIGDGHGFMASITRIDQRPYSS